MSSGRRHDINPDNLTQRQVVQTGVTDIVDAIQTKYLRCTNTRGARIKAWNDAGSITIPYPHELHGQAVHRAAAEALVAKQGMDTPFYGKLLGGSVPGGYVFIHDNDFARD